MMKRVATLQVSELKDKEGLVEATGYRTARGRCAALTAKKGGGEGEGVGGGPRLAGRASGVINGLSQRSRCPARFRRKRV